MELYLFLTFLMTFSLSAPTAAAFKDDNTSQKHFLSSEEFCSNLKGCTLLADSQDHSDPKALNSNLTPCQARCAANHGNPFSCFCPY